MNNETTIGDFIIKLDDNIVTIKSTSDVNTLNLLSCKLLSDVTANVFSVWSPVESKAISNYEILCEIVKKYYEKP